nr:FH2 domain-containing protein 1-like [Anolis sagrei ordinatus]
MALIGEKPKGIIYLLQNGGYAGSALGFRVPSLLRLTDTKANRPGMDLLHFMALEVERKEPALLCFPSKLPHVGPASRIVEGEVLAELRCLGARLRGARGWLGALGWEGRLGPFLEAAEAELGATWASWEGMRRAQAALADFLCEETLGFSLPDSCAIFQAFAERFQVAVQVRRRREEGPIPLPNPAHEPLPRLAGGPHKDAPVQASDGKQERKHVRGSKRGESSLLFLQVEQFR